MFSILQNADVDDNTRTTTPIPASIYIPDVVSFDKMLSNISNIIPKIDFNYKPLRNNPVMLIIKIKNRNIKLYT